jgi:hypothetical protein
MKNNNNNRSKVRKKGVKMMKVGWELQKEWG